MNNISKYFGFLLILFFFFCYPNLIICQHYNQDFGFKRNIEIGVHNNTSQPLQFPWSGGMNSVRFSEIDLNNDGLKDLFIFEKNGNRILPFINTGENNYYCYQFAPQYARQFPKLHDWVILKDYNLDGKEDIFTYGLASIVLYKNISQNTLEFELITDEVQSYYYNSYVNIYASPDDYLVVEDVDGDGLLDILNFWLLGKYVHFQKNYGTTPDNFYFRLEDECWGHFSEGSDNNIITLFTDCNTKNFENEPTRHVGSSMLLHDFTGDGLKDLVLGDSDYPNLLLLINGGSVDSAYMVRQLPDFPNSNSPVHLFSMPVCSVLDIDNDLVDELIVSPSDPSLIKSRDLESVWKYEFNQLTHQYELENTSFMQEEMIDVGSGAFPVLFDWDGDGLLDLFIGNYGSYDSSNYINGFLHSYYTSSITYYRNTGSIDLPEFELITRDFGNIRRYGLSSLYPAFGDFNGDSITDLLCGSEDGKLILFINNHHSGEPDFALPIYNYQNIDAGEFSTPQLFDLDNDGKKDLIIGNKRGLLSYYRNISTNHIPQFQLVRDTLGGVDVRDFEISYFGYSVPCFLKNASGETVLFCGSEQGNIFYYNNIDGNLSGNFDLQLAALYEIIENRRYNIEEGIRIAACAGDLNNDHFPELIAGNWAGGVSYFEGIAVPDSTIGFQDISGTIQIKIFPNPCKEIVNVEISNTNNCINGNLELFDITGRVIKSIIFSESRFSFNTAEMKAGIYFGKIIYKDNIKEFKIIKL